MATEGNRLGGTDFDTKMLTADEIIALLEGKQDLIQPYMQDPLMDGTPSYGNISTYAAGNHRHPTDTSRQGQLVAQQVGEGKVKTVVAQILNNGSLTSVELTTKDFVPDGGQYVLKAGDTMTGPLTIHDSLTVGERADGSTVGTTSVAEGYGITASGEGAHAEGRETVAQNEYEHAQGRYNASHTGSRDADITIHSIGVGTPGIPANAVEVMRDGKVFVKGVGGYNGTNPTTATNLATAVNGKVNKSGDTMSGGLTVRNLTVGLGRATGSTVGENSVAAGEGPTASGLNSHAEGIYATASGEGAHAEGCETVAQNEYEHAQGQYNASHTGYGTEEKTIHSIGVGTSSNARKNAVEVMQDGKVFVYGLGGYNGTNPNGSGVKDLVTAIDGMTDPVFTEWKNGSSIVAGNRSSAGLTSVAIGNRATASGQKSIAISSSDEANSTAALGLKSIAVGFYAKASKDETIAIGNRAEASAAGAIQLGYGTNDESNTFKVGDYKLLDAEGYIPPERIRNSGGPSDRIVSQDGDTRVVANDDGTATLDNDYLAPRPIVHLTAGTFSGGHSGEIVLQNDVTANMNEATPVTTPGGTHYDLTIDGVTYSYGADSSQGVVYRWFNVNSEYGFDITDWDSRNPTIALNESTGASYTGTATASRLATGSKVIATVDQIEHVDIVSPTTDGSGSGKAADANATGLAMELSPVYSEWTTVPAEYNGYPIVIRLVNNVNWSPFANGEQIGMGYSDSGQLSLNWSADSAYIPIAATRSIDGYTLGGQTEKPLASMSSVPSEKIVSKDGNTSVKANNDGTATLLSPGTVSKTVVLSAEGANGATFHMEFSSFNSPEELASAAPESISGTLTITVPGSSSPVEFTDTWYRIQPESGAPVYVEHSISQDWRFYFTSSNCDIFSGSGGGGCTAVYTTGSVDVPTTVTKTLATTDQIPVVPSLPISVANGGTGATTSAGALANLGALSRAEAEAGFTEWRPASDDPGYSLISVTYDNNRWTIVVLLDGETSPWTYTDNSGPDATAISFSSDVDAIVRTRLPTMADIPAIAAPSIDPSAQGKAADAMATGNALAGKLDRPFDTNNGCIPVWTAEGQLQDSGKAPADFATSAQGAKADSSVQQASAYRMDISENGDVTVSPNGSYVYESKYGVQDQSNQLSACFNQTNVADYSDSASYDAGDLVVYDGRTYECMAYPYSPGTSPDDDPSAWSLAVAADIRGFFVRIALSQPVSSTAPAEAHAEVLYFFGPLVGGDDRYDLRPAFEFDATYSGGQLGNAINLSLHEVLQKDGTSIPVTSDMYGVVGMQTAQISDNTGAGGPFVVAGGPLVWSRTDPGFSMPAYYTIPRQDTVLTVDDHFITGGTNPVQNGVITTKFSHVDTLINALDASKANSLALAPNFSPGQGAAYREVGDLVTYLGYMYRCKVAGYDSMSHVPGQDASYWDLVSVSDIVGNINSVLDAINGEVI